MLQRGDTRGPDQTDCSCPREEMMRPELRPGSGSGKEGGQRHHSGETPEATGEVRNDWKRARSQGPVKALNDLSQEPQMLKVQRWQAGGHPEWPFPTQRGMLKRGPVMPPSQVGLPTNSLFLLSWRTSWPSKHGSPHGVTSREVPDGSLCSPSSLQEVEISPEQDSHRLGRLSNVELLKYCLLVQNVHWSSL